MVICFGLLVYLSRDMSKGVLGINAKIPDQPADIYSLIGNFISYVLHYPIIL